MAVKVLGTGCAKCKSTIALIGDVVKAKGVVIDGKVVHTGSAPRRDRVQQRLQARARRAPP